MPTKIIDLEDRIITDQGQVVFKYDFFFKKAMSGEVFTNYQALPDPDIEAYNFRKNEDLIEIWVDDNEPIGPPDESFDWILPKKYLNLDLVDYSVQRLKERGLTSELYQERLAFELEEMGRRGMFPFIRCVLFVVDKFRENNVVWGVGRGSSCASLVLFVLGINRVDPVKYDIPVEEFIK